MLRNFLTSSLRNLLKYKIHSLINIGGLGVALAAVMTIGLYVEFETSFDSQWNDVDTIYRVENYFHVPGRSPLPAVTTPRPMKEAVLRDFAVIEEATHFSINNLTLRHLHQLDRQAVMQVDDKFFDFFQFPFKSGSSDSFVGNPNAIIVTETLAEKYFGSEDPIGKAITVAGYDDYIVTGVLEDLPANTHMTFEALMPWSAGFVENVFPNAQLDRWLNLGFFMYIRVRSDEQLRQIDEGMEDFLDRNVVIDTDSVRGYKAHEFLKYRLLPIRDIHLHSQYGGNMKPPGDASLVFALGAIGLLVLFIACINMMNLSTARSTLRVKEVAMRKTFGASRNQIAVQYLFESLVSVIIALLVCMTIMEIALPLVNEHLGLSLSLSMLFSPGWLAAIPLMILVVVLLGGLYPAFYLASFDPVAVLSATQQKSKGGPTIRSVLVFLQFSITIVIISATLVVHYQGVFTSTKPLGFTSDRVVLFENLFEARFQDSLDALQSRVEALPFVESAGYGAQFPSHQGFIGTSVRLPGADRQEQIEVIRTNVTPGFFETLQVPVVAGRLFSFDQEADRVDFDINQDMDEVPQGGAIIPMDTLKKLGFDTPESALGTVLQVGGSRTNTAYVTVIGVIPIVQYESLHEQVQARIYIWGNTLRNNLGFRMTEVTPQNMDRVREVWNELFPDAPPRIRVLEENMEQAYLRDRRAAGLFNIFSMLAVLISCLGLYGLTTFAVERRRREIGIRKVLGATSGSIVAKLLWDFSKPVILANIVAWPVAWYVANLWLSRFAFRIEPGAGLFLSASAIALAIAWLTVIALAYRAALARPVNVLRYE